ncbi:MAG: hypothetical protein QOK41_1718 [Sphingomonadales bacterium]|jgi:hypothetical protein|nr:hypothetical protein [Sphingomonadales bacterium]
MQLVRHASVSRSRRFGRGPARVLAVPAAAAPGLFDDLKLFATTFLAGFLFVSILIG